MRAQAITHVAIEDLGSWRPVLADAGFAIADIDACTVDWTALDPLAADLVIVLGGPIGVGDADDFPLVGHEIDFLRRRLAARRPTLGVCLGAQMMAAALGARVYPGGAGVELGWAEIHPGRDAAPWMRPLFAPGVKVMHWHGDTFDLPAGAAHLARSAQYENQGFAIGDHALALQCHPEVTAESLQRWAVCYGGDLVRAGLKPADLRAAGAAHAPALAAASAAMLRGWLGRAFPAAAAS